MEHLPNDHREDHPNQHNNSNKLCSENGNLIESQWKLRQQHDQYFTMEGKPL